MKFSDSFDVLSGLLTKIEVTNNEQASVPLNEGALSIIGLFNDCRRAHNKIMFIGNGASASISSHMATDYLKNGQIRAMAFNDPVLITCFGNDFGYENAFSKAVEFYADSGDVLVCISSSGKSINILRAVETAKNKGCHIVTLSGYEPNNALRQLGDLNVYVPMNQYGHVEIIHHAFCHYILDNLVRSYL